MISVFLGAFAGYIAMTLPKYGFFVIGAVFGVMIGLVLDEVWFDTWPYGGVWFVVVSLILGIFLMLAIGFGIASYVKWKNLVVWITSGIGAFSIT